MFYGISSSNFDFKTTKAGILEYAQKNQFLISDFLSDITLPLREGHFASQNGEGSEIKIKSGDILIAPSLTYFGLNLLKSLASIVAIAENKIQIHFIQQPELSICDDKFTDRLATFKTMLESERAFISARAKAGMAASKAKGVKLGRPKGATQKVRALDKYKKEILDYLQKDISISSIMKIINCSLETKLSYFSFKSYVDQLQNQ